MFTLAIDTSSKACSAAIFSGTKLLWESYLDTGNTHSCTLMPLVANGLTTIGIKAMDISTFAISNGPGSFTGLRIGLATLKGLAFGSQKPCIEVSTLLSLAYNCQLVCGHILSVLDARGGQVYAALFKVEDGEISYAIKDTALAITDLKELLPKDTILVGDGAELVFKTLCGYIPLKLSPPHLRLQRASSVGMAAFDLLKAGAAPKTHETIELSYLRRPQAERERLAALDEK